MKQKTEVQPSTTVAPPSAQFSNYPLSRPMSQNVAEKESADTQTGPVDMKRQLKDMNISYVFLSRDITRMQPNRMKINFKSFIQKLNSLCGIFNDLSNGLKSSMRFRVVYDSVCVFVCDLHSCIYY